MPCQKLPRAAVSGTNREPARVTDRHTQHRDEKVAAGQLLQRPLPVAISAAFRTDGMSLRRQPGLPARPPGQHDPLVRRAGGQLQPRRNHPQHHPHPEQLNRQPPVSPPVLRSRHGNNTALAGTRQCLGESVSITTQVHACPPTAGHRGSLPIRRRHRTPHQMVVPSSTSQHAGRCVHSGAHTPSRQTTRPLVTADALPGEPSFERHPLTICRANDYHAAR